MRFHDWPNMIALAGANAVLCAGCAATQYATGKRPADSSAPPLSSLFWRLHRQRNRPSANDCSNKAGRYARALRREGYRATVVVVHRPAPHNSLHAVVKVDDRIYCDPAFGTWGSDLSRFGQYRFALKDGDQDSWGTAFK